MLPPNRQLKKLSEVVDINSGIALPNIFREDKNDGDFSFFKVGHMNNDKIYMKGSNYKFTEEESVKNKIKIFPKGSILIPKRGAAIFTNKKRILLEDASYDSNIMGLFPHQELSTEYLFNFLLSIDLGSYTDDAGIAQINNKHIEKILIPLPPLPVQHKIVEKLDEASAQITASKSAIQSQLDALDQLWQSSLSEVFENEEYELVKLSSIIEKSSQINPLNKPQDVFTYIDISSIDKEIQKITNPNSFIGKDAPSRAKKHIQQGDIVFATTRPNLKNIAIIENDYENLVASTGFCVLRPTKKVIRNYLFYFLITDQLQDQISPLIRGAQYPAISDKDLLSCGLRLPDLSTQTRIVSQLDDLSQNISSLRSQYTTQLQHFDDLRASILDQAFKGELVEE